jgi:hypothetical protein
MELDAAGHRAVIALRGKERGGAGSVDATATLSGNGEQTVVEMVTDVQITGRVAQFGQGIIADVSSRITQRFVAALTEKLTAEHSAATSKVPPTANAAQSEPAALDLGAVAFGPVLKRALPAALVLAGVAAILKLLLD